jgi:hypothetical protein
MKKSYSALRMIVLINFVLHGQEQEKSNLVIARSKDNVKVAQKNSGNVLNAKDIVELREKLENIEYKAHQRKDLHGPWLVTYVLLLFFVGLLGFKFFSVGIYILLWGLFGSYLLFSLLLRLFALLS